MTLDVRLSADPMPADGVGVSDGDGSDSGAAATGDDQESAEPPGARLGATWVPDEAFVATWARRAVDAAMTVGSDPRLAGTGPLALELSVHFAGIERSRGLNRDHRGRDRPTNVLSFPSGLPALPTEVGHAEGANLVVLGDLVPCPEVIRREAVEQGKDERAHWAHLVVHGTLHLLGLDHEDEPAALAMEAVETELLSTGGWPDPYRAMLDEAGR